MATNTTKWQHIGVISPGGTVSNIAGTDALWLATEAGLFGQAGADGWQPLAQGQPLNRLNALAAQEQVLMSGNAQGQLVYSSNGGQSWYRGYISGDSSPITWLTLAPNFTESRLALAATDGAGILRSTNGGKSWQSANFGLQEFSVWVLATSPSWRRREIVFAATPGGVYRSPNGGRAWKKSSAGLEGMMVQALAVSPNFEADRTIFAGTETGGVFRSANGGKSWEPRNTGLAAANGELPPVNALWLAPDFAESPGCVAATGDGRLFHSANGGQEWRQVDAPGVPVLCLGGNADALYAGLYRRGLLRSVDGGQSWTAEEGLTARSLTRLTAAGSGLLAFGPLGQVWRAAQTGSAWEAVTLPDNAPLLTLAAQGDVTLAATATGLLRSENGGDDWQSVLSDVEVLALHFSPNFAADQTVWAGNSSGGLLRTMDGGQSWRNLTPPQTEQPLVALAAHNNTLAAATFAVDNQQVTLWRSGSQAESWQQWQQVTTEWPSVHVEWFGAAAVACIDTRCWVSSGAGWERVLKTEHPIVRLAQLPNAGGLLLLTSRQVFHSQDGKRWAAVDDGLPQQALLDLAVTPAEEGRAIATILTTGGALWLAEF